MDAHHAEYLAAAAAIHDQTPRRPTLAEGDFVSGITAGRRWSGRIEWIDGDRVTIDVGGGWLAVNANDIRF